MKHQITTKTTGDEWEQVMTCEFANATIAELVLADTPNTIFRHGNIYCYIPNKRDVAKLERNGKVVTVTSYVQMGGWALHWDTDSNTNQEELEKIAQAWQEQERAWLPIMRYFQIAKEKHNEALREWGKKHDERLNGLEHRIKELERKLDADEKHLEATNDFITKELRKYGEALTDLQDAFSLHGELRFHSMDKGGDK